MHKRTLQRVSIADHSRLILQEKDGPCLSERGQIVVPKMKKGKWEEIELGTDLPMTRNGNSTTIRLIFFFSDYSEVTTKGL